MGAFVFEYFDPVKSCIFSVTTMPPEAERRVDEAVCDIFFQLSINTDSVPHEWGRGIAEEVPNSALYVPFDPRAPATAAEGGEGAAAEAGAEAAIVDEDNTMPVLTPPPIATPPRPPPPAMQAPSAPPMRPNTSSLPPSLRDEIVRGMDLSPVASRDVGAHTPSPRPSTAPASELLRRAALLRRNSVNGLDSSD